MTVQLPKRFKYLFKPKRFKIYYGGRGGAKTVSFSKILLSIGAQEKKRVLCVREYMNSIEDSVHSSLEQEVENLDLSDFYKVDKNKITGANGTVFKYAGLARNISSLKSKDRFDIVWNEEAQTTSQRSLDILIPTIRKAGSELWFSFNPDFEDDPVYVEWVIPFLDVLNKTGFYENNESLIVKTNLSNNPFAPQELIEDSARLKKKNPKKHAHIYGGECGGNYDDPIFEVENFRDYEILAPDYDFQAIFADTALKDGEQNDYTVFQCWAKYGGRIYLVDQFRKKIKATYLKEKIIEFWNKHKRNANTVQPLRALYVEDKASGIQLIQDIQRDGGIPIIGIPRPRGSGKVLRANNFSPWITAGLVCLPKHQSWVYDYKQEFDQFNADMTHAHDDQIDPTLDAIEHMLLLDGSKMPKEEDKSKTTAPAKDAKIW